MRTYFKRYMRDNMEQHIIQKYKKIYPQFEMESSALRVPNFANVVIYSNVTSADDFINNIFPFFRLVTPTSTSQDEHEFTRSVALNMISQSENDQYRGSIVYGFPFNSNQALILDRFLGGVNLAVHIRHGEPSSDISPLLKYYDERGSLLEIDYKEDISGEEIEKIQVKVLQSMKESL